MNSVDVDDGCVVALVIGCIGCVGLTSIGCGDRRDGDRRAGGSLRGFSRFLGDSPMLRRVASSRASGSSTPCPCIALVDCLIPGICVMRACRCTGGGPPNFPGEGFELVLASASGRIS